MLAVDSEACGQQSFRKWCTPSCLMAYKGLANNQGAGENLKQKKKDEKQSGRERKALTEPTKTRVGFSGDPLFVCPGNDLGLRKEKTLLPLLCIELQHRRRDCFSSPG
ncbi:hypothetical protein MRB53_018860 [Persea americana]|uniref:Uncharacterized protein n=1 Tax=Persea americana TaxID=3435 RepID=A0ACC2M965_PERAE|nr:hypothetical protein MRB53_018860 [Persea americana]